MKKVTPTIWSSRLQTMKQQGKPYTHMPFSTINERLGIQANAAVASGDMPYVGVLCIGNGGHAHQTGANGFPLTRMVPHLPDHAGLYNQIPFVIRTMDADLSQTERRKYALRKIETIEGVNYICYYGRRIVIDPQVPVDIKHTVVTDGVKTTTNWVPNNSNLYPTPPELPNTGAISTSGEYLSTSSVISMSFGESDVEELLNVARVLYNDEDYAVISEFAICTAVDRVVSITTPAGQVNFSEAVHCSVAVFAAAMYNLVFNRKGFTYTIESGSTEPLLGAEQINTAVLIGP